MSRRWYESTTARMLLLLSLALLPLGYFAVSQTERLERELGASYSAALRGFTKEAAAEQRIVIGRALSVANAVGALAETLPEDPATCSQRLADALEGAPQFIAIALLPQSGLITCSSEGGGIDVSDAPASRQAAQDTGTIITISRNGPVSGVPALLVSRPYTIEGAYAGRVVVSIPIEFIAGVATGPGPHGLVDLLTLDTEGRLLASRNAVSVDEYPTDTTRDSLLTDGDLLMAQNRAGSAERLYSTARIAESPLILLGIWETTAGQGALLSSFEMPRLIPWMTWIVTLIVAFWSIHLLVLRHVSKLRSDMRKFEVERILPNNRIIGDIPSEFEDLRRNFASMADSSLREEARLENLLREQNILIKEVHHRVKNNLQLIISMINLQQRATEREDVRAELGQLQNRVMGLASLHGNIYGSDSDGQIDATRLVSDALTSALGDVDPDLLVETRTDFAPVQLYADQAVPLAMLASELFSEALYKLAGEPVEDRTLIVAFSAIDGRCTLTIDHPESPRVMTPARAKVSSFLIRAFALELGATHDTATQDGRCVHKVAFALGDALKQGHDF